MSNLCEDLEHGFSLALGIEPGAELRRYVAEGKGRLAAQARLLAWDANSIHAFVFDTTNATGIRGASDILKETDNELRRGNALGVDHRQILFAGGGSGLAVIAQEREAESVDRLHRLFATRTLVATCSAAAVDLVSESESFADRAAAAGRELARGRALTGPDAEPAVPFFVERCRVCGRRAAAEAPPRGVSREPRLECEPCNLRIERGKKNVRYQHEPSDYAAVADDAGKGFYAALYADGNGVGRALTSLDSPLRYATFSRALAELVRKSFEETAQRYGLAEDSENGGNGHSAGTLQLPICGGDDLVAILPGKFAVPFARDLLARLQAKADANPDLKAARFGASAGVAIGHVKFPIRHLLGEAEELLSMAKRRVYANPTNVRSALSFAVVTDGSPRSESVEPERWARGGAEMLLSGCPYELGEVERFSRRLTAFRQRGGVGGTQLYALKRHALSGAAQLRNHVLYQIGRRSEWRELVEALAGGDTGVLRDKERCFEAVVPVYGGRRVFDVADMIEVLDHWREPAEAGAEP